MTSNSLKMPLQEWMWRMSAAEVPIQACGLAMFATVFKVTTNEDLARLANMDTKGCADKTYNKWKQYLSANGWVVLKSVVVGRLTLIEVGPAFKHTPVIFTNVDMRDWKKYQDQVASGTVKATSENYERTEQSTGENYERAEEITDETSKNYEPKVKTTDASRALVPARLESSLREDSYTLKGVSEGKEDNPLTPVDALDAFNAYNDLAQRVGLALARTLTPQRRRALIARMREHGGIAAWHQALGNIEKSAFLQGGNERGWRASLDFLLQASSFTKVVEGNYGNGAHAQPKEGEYDKIGRLLREANDRQHPEPAQRRIT